MAICTENVLRYTVCFLIKPHKLFLLEAILSQHASVRQSQRDLTKKSYAVLYKNILDFIGTFVARTARGIIPPNMDKSNDDSSMFGIFVLEKTKNY